MQSDRAPDCEDKDSGGQHAPGEIEVDWVVDGAGEHPVHIGIDRPAGETAADSVHPVGHV